MMTSMPERRVSTAPEGGGSARPQSGIDARFPRALDFLWKPARYKVAYGGRGSGKSWSIARALLLKGAEQKLRIMCAREFQKSIADSVHQLLTDQITNLGLSGVYSTTKTGISAVNGTEFLFAGLRHNVANLKSVEGCDIVWVEEAQTVSRNSWETLIPTVRKDNSEIWVSFNPDLETDDSYRRFVISPPPGAIVRKVNWSDNPWFPAVLRQEMEYCRLTNQDAYQHIWEGCCVSILEGAIYANELRQVDRENRITRVSYDRTRPVQTFWDLGFGDSTSVWFAQAFPFEYRLIDFVQNSRQPLSWYLKQLQERPYVYSKHHLPHDGKARQLGSGKSIEELMREAGLSVEIVPRLSILDGINAAREIFPLCWFDAERCADGLQALRRYRYGVNETLNVPTREPLHDENSHSADAFRYFAIGILRPDAPQPQPADTYPNYGSWMA